MTSNETARAVIDAIKAEDASALAEALSAACDEAMGEDDDDETEEEEAKPKGKGPALLIGLAKR
jgi:hypothetical protein